MKDECISDVVAVFVRRGGILVDYRFDLRSRPMLGGAFGHGGYSLASLRSQARGLFCVYYCVVHDDSGTPLSFEHTVPDALSEARSVLTILTPVQRNVVFRSVKEALRVRANAALEAQRELLRIRRESVQSALPPKKIPRRRRAIFEKSNGECHYCGTPLALDGKWHIEHKMPRALLGGDESANLVASCVSCNHRKRDRTDLEFIAAEKGAAA